MPVTDKLLRNLLIGALAGGAIYVLQPFLVPVAFGFMLAMLLTPICTWLEKKGIAASVAPVICVVLFLAFISGIIALLWWQVAGVAEDADQIALQINKIPKMAQDYISRTLGVSAERQLNLLKEQTSALTSKAGGKMVVAAGSILSISGKFLLVTIYTFLFIFYRKHLASFLLKLVPAQEQPVAEKIMSSCGEVAQKYIVGLGIMIATLWVMYGIGFSIIGIKHALFFAILCGLLETVPYVGNLTGSLLTAVLAFTQGGTSMALWVLAVYGIVQFTQTYLLEPLIVGAKVSINPLFTIMAIIAGEMLWGIPGMVLAIPILAIFKIICDNIPSLRPYGFLVGEVKYPNKRHQK